MACRGWQNPPDEYGPLVVEQRAVNEGKEVDIAARTEATRYRRSIEVECHNGIAKHAADDVAAGLDLSDGFRFEREGGRYGGRHATEMERQQ